MVTVLIFGVSHSWAETINCERGNLNPTATNFHANKRSLFEELFPKNKSFSVREFRSREGGYDSMIHITGSVSPGIIKSILSIKGAMSQTHSKYKSVTVRYKCDKNSIQVREIRNAMIDAESQVLATQKESSESLSNISGSVITSSSNSSSSASALCNLATKLDKTGQRVWEDNPALLAEVENLKKSGETCGVGVEFKPLIAGRRTDNHFAGAASQSVCFSVVAHKDPLALQEAKRRGLNCSGGEASTKPEEPTNLVSNNEGLSDAQKKIEELEKLLAEEKRKGEEAAELAEEKRKGEEAAELAEEKRKAEEAAKLAEEKRKAEEKETIALENAKIDEEVQQGIDNFVAAFKQTAELKSIITEAEIAGENAEKLVDEILGWIKLKGYE